MGKTNKNTNMLDRPVCSCFFFVSTSAERTGGIYFAFDLLNNIKLNICPFKCDEGQKCDSFYEFHLNRFNTRRMHVSKFESIYKCDESRISPEGR